MVKIGVVELLQFLLFSLLLNQLACSENKRDLEDLVVSEWEPTNALDVLPVDVRSRVKLNPHSKPYHGYRIECRVRSISSRTVNVTHISPDEPPLSLRLKPLSILSLGVRSNTTLKINEILTIGGGNDSTEILGEDLASYAININSTYFAFHDSAEHKLNSVPDEIIAEEQYYRSYLEDNGMPWHHYYNSSSPPPGQAHITPLRGPPSMFMWDAAEIGQTHQVFSEHGYWICDGFASVCQDKKTLPLTLHTISTSPKLFVIPNFLNEYECDRIIQLAIKGMNVSQTGGGTVSDYRTSLTSWLARRVSPVVDSLYRRAADVLRVHEKELTRRSELLQVVNYHFGEQYKSHFDWSRRDGIGGNSRYLTMLLYLTDQVDDNAGGETLFPNAEAGALAIRPVKGTAALFYNLLPDGNGDVSSLHQALPIRKGEKWLSNMWVWDPNYMKF